jgi:hypothetical protein
MVLVGLIWLSIPATSWGTASSNVIPRLCNNADRNPRYHYVAIYMLLYTHILYQRTTEPDDTTGRLFVESKAREDFSIV